MHAVPPRRESVSEASWEPLDTEGVTFYAVMGSEDTSTRPWAILVSQKEAERWIGLSGHKRAYERGDVCILPVRCLSGIAWNSTDPLPEDGPEPCEYRDGDKVPCARYRLDGKHGYCEEHRS